MKYSFYNILKVVLLVVSCFTCTACSEKKMLVSTKLAGKKVYYLDFSSLPGRKGIPFVPSDQISEEKAKLLDHYLEATYDNEGRMIEFLSKKKGKILLRQIITYKGDQYATVTLFDQNGKVSMKLP